MASRSDVTEDQSSLRDENADETLVRGLKATATLMVSLRDGSEIEMRPISQRWALSHCLRENAVVSFPPQLPDGL